MMPSMFSKDKIPKWASVTFAATACAMLTSCALTKSPDTLKAAADTFNKSVQSASAALDTERKAKPRTRRFEAVEYYILTRRIAKTPGVAVVIDIDAGDQLKSFAKFACAGRGSLIREKNALDFATAYSSGLTDVLAQGPDTLAGQFARLKALNAPITVPPPSPPPGSTPSSVPPVESCADQLVTQISGWKPVPTTDTYDENPVAILSAAIAAYQAIDKFLTTGLTTYNNYKERQKFKEYVNKWDAEFQKVITQDLPADRLTDAWSHRVVVSIQQPLATFREIFNIPDKIKPGDDDARIRDLGLRANAELAEFDALSVAPKPPDIRSALLEANKKLVAAANDDKVSLDELVSFLSGLVDAFNTAKQQYDDANKAAQTLVATVHK